MAAELGVNETSLRTALFQMRKRYRTMIENEIRETVASPAAEEEELEHFRDILKLG